MKKSNNNALIIHSLELKIFQLELEKNLQKLKIKKRKTKPTNKD